MGSGNLVIVANESRYVAVVACCRKYFVRNTDRMNSARRDMDREVPFLSCYDQTCVTKYVCSTLRCCHLRQR